MLGFFLNLLIPPDSKIRPPPEGKIIPYAQLEDCRSSEASKAACRELLAQLVVVKLNGGLGTSMGCKGPKSVIAVRQSQTFLDLTLRQIEARKNTQKSK